MKNSKDIHAIVQALKDLYPDGICSLQYKRTMSCSLPPASPPNADERVNQVTPALFARFPTPEALAEGRAGRRGALHPLLRLFPGQGQGHCLCLPHAAGTIPWQGAGHHGGAALPARGGQKNRQPYFGRCSPTPGVVVADTHCIRITGLLGLTDGTKDPGKVEKQLRACLPPEESNDFCHRLVLHGRAVCRARKPDCPNCTLRPWCDHFQKNA